MTRNEIAELLLGAALREVQLRAGADYDEEAILKSLPELCRGRVLRTNTIRDLADSGTASVLKFIQECCNVGDEYRTRTSDLTAAFTVWCMRNGHVRINDRRFGIALEKLGFPKVSDKYRARIAVDYQSKILSS